MWPVSPSSTKLTLPHFKIQWVLSHVKFWNKKNKDLKKNNKSTMVTGTHCLTSFILVPTSPWWLMTCESNLVNDKRKEVENPRDPIGWGWTNQTSTKSNTLKITRYSSDSEKNQTTQTISRTTLLRNTTRKDRKGKLRKNVRGKRGFKV